MEVRLAAAKTHKYAVSESGDTLEVTERPRGGVSLILADGQGSGRSAKLNSSMVVAKCVSMISEGARDGAVARAVHDMLYSSRDGRVSAELLIASADLNTQTLVISRNTACPVLICRNGETSALHGDAEAIGVRRSTKPVIDVFPLEPKLTILGFSDGIWFAGRHMGNPWGVDELTEVLLQHSNDPEALVEAVLNAALQRDNSRPRDDMSVFSICVRYNQGGEKIRRLHVSLPL